MRRARFRPLSLLLEQVQSPLQPRTNNAFDLGDDDDGVNDIIEAACERRLATVEHSLDTKIKKWQRDVNDQLQDSLRSMEEQITSANQQYDEKRDSDHSEVKKELTRLGTLIQQQQLSSSKHFGGA